MTAHLAALPADDAYRAVLTFLGTLILGGLLMSLAGAVLLRPVGAAVVGAALVGTDGAVESSE